MSYEDATPTPADLRETFDREDAARRAHTRRGLLGAAGLAILWAISLVNVLWVFYALALAAPVMLAIGEVTARRRIKADRAALLAASEDAHAAPAEDDAPGPGHLRNDETTRTWTMNI